MAASLSRLIFAYPSTSGIFDGLFACRYQAGSYADPALPFDENTNGWYMLEEIPLGEPDESGDYEASYFTKEIPAGKYRIMKHDTVEGYATLSPYENIFHGTLDAQNHIESIDSDLMHKHSQIQIAIEDQGRYGETLDEALDNISGQNDAGDEWDKDLDDSLKAHLDKETGAHEATAISHTIDAISNVGDILDDHESRIDALETGSASTPTNINDLSGEIGVDIYWDEQDVTGIEYYVKFLWKHDYETTPSLSNLEHQSRIGSPFFNINYGTRRFDIAINTDDDLVLYYAIGAKGRADASIQWSAICQTGVIIPSYRQEQIITLDSISLSNYTGNLKGSEHIDSDEEFPTCSGEAGGVPDDNYLIWSPMDDITIKEIKVRSGSAMSGTATVKYYSTTGGESGSLTVSSATQRGSANELSINVDDGDDLQIWSLDPKGMGHYTVQIKFDIRS